MEAAAALCSAQPGDDQLAMFGLKRSDFDQTLHIWPDNWNVVRLFETLQTQWKIVPGGDRFVFTGIDYATAVLMAKTLGMEFTPDFFADFRVLEDEGLRHLNERK